MRSGGLHACRIDACAIELIPARARYLLRRAHCELYCRAWAQVDEVLAACTHPDIVRALFSATLPEQVRCVCG